MRQHVAKRPIKTTIRMSASAFDVTSTDLTKEVGEEGRVVVVNLVGAHPSAKESVAATLCELHGIGTKKQWAKYDKQMAKEAAERRAKWKAKRKDRAAVAAKLLGVRPTTVTTIGL